MQHRFRLVFTAWGLPDAVRVDNGAPWGSAGDLPPSLSLWLCGLAVPVIWNPPRQPQYNGVVERSNQLVKAWAEPSQCRTAAELQRRVDIEDKVQREDYPACAGQSRTQSFAALKVPRRRYTLRWERRHWSFELVKDWLSHYAVPRRVDGSGKIGLYGGKLYVGTRHKQTDVLLQLDPDRVEWVVSNRQNQQIARIPADGLHKYAQLQLPSKPESPQKRLNFMSPFPG